MTKFFLDGPRISFESIRGTVNSVSSGYIDSTSISINNGEIWSSSLGINASNNWSFILNDANNGFTISNDINLTEIIVLTFGSRNGGSDNYGEEDTGQTNILIEWDKNRIRGLSYQYQTTYFDGISSYYWNSNSITVNGLTTVTPVILHASMLPLISSFQIDTQNSIRSITRFPIPYNSDAYPQMPQFVIKNYRIQQV